MLNRTFISHQHIFDVIRIILICWLSAITISQCSRSADSTVAERIRERSLLLVYSFRSSNSSKRSRIHSATVESGERDY